MVWTYDYDILIKDADGTLQELGDATMLSNGNILFCRKVGASEITPDKKIIWDIVAPKDTEIHSVQPLGTNPRAARGKCQVREVDDHQHADGSDGKRNEPPDAAFRQKPPTCNSAACA